MPWDFSTEPEFEQKLDWARAFVREEVQPLDLVFPSQVYQPATPEIRRLIEPLKQQVRDAQLWACHLGPELGGQGYGQLKLALLNEVLGRSFWAPRIFGCHAPDSGNAEILAHYGTEEQKAKYLRPLLDGEIFSCYSMTEPQGGSDPGEFQTTAVRDGDEWVVNGHKFFSSNARAAEFFIVMAYTDRDAGPHRGMSMFIVPASTPGLVIERDIGLWNEPVIGEGDHGYVRYDDVRVPLDHLLGEEGKAFAVAQTRLGGGRIHHAMRTIGIAQRALDMMCERALSRHTKGSLLADKQAVQHHIADAYAQLVQLRLFVLYTAWQIDHYKDYKRVRKDISSIKVLSSEVLRDVVHRAITIHGALGVSNELPLGIMTLHSYVVMMSDGPPDIHKTGVAKALLEQYTPAPGQWPTEHLPSRVRDAEARVGRLLGREVAPAS